MKLTFITTIIALGQVFCTMEVGLYEAILQNVTSCIVQQPFFQYNISTYTNNGRKLIHGSIVTLKELKDLKFRVQLHYIQTAKVKAFDIKNQNCRNKLIRVALQEIGIVYDSKKCILRARSFPLENINMDKLLHRLVDSLWYGPLQIQFEIAVATTQVLCLDINLHVIKAKTNEE